MVYGGEKNDIIRYLHAMHKKTAKVRPWRVGDNPVHVTFKIIK
jgi:hypothetical protein